MWEIPIAPVNFHINLIKNYDLKKDRGTCALSNWDIYYTILADCARSQRISSEIIISENDVIIPAYIHASVSGLRMGKSTARDL